MDKVNIQEKFNTFSDSWNPRIIAELNGQQVKAARLTGEFVWHHHEAEDEMFLAVSGSFRIEFRDKTVNLNEGEFVIVPRGVEHRPVANEEVEVLLFEPAQLLNTGNIVDEKFTAPVGDKI